VLAAGTKLGPYELAEPLGAGGMGEVYRAHDPRLRRDVAVKIIPPALAGDPARLRRFEQEARAAAALNHPNILAVYDIGTENGTPYIVSERLEGESLRERLRGGALPLKKALDYAQQIARGLAAAHDNAILHRDLKPENIFVTRDGRLKILDFGLAKLTHREESPADRTLSVDSEMGTMVGTAGYMSPEQVRGQPVDARSDVFSFGAVLYEMLSGQRAFHGESVADTVTAILTREPPDLTSTNRNVTPALDRVVRHCLEKNREERFQSARDLTFDLEPVSAGSTAGVPPLKVATNRPWTRVALGAAAILLVALAALITRAWLAKPANQPEFRRLTFRRGVIRAARFAPDGQTVIYGAAWEGSPAQLFNVHFGSSESRSFRVGSAQVLAISKAGEVAFLKNPVTRAFMQVGTLARMPLNGGAPRELLGDVQFADWSPDGSTMAVVRYRLAGGVSWIEYPVGRVIYRGTAWISHLRISPDGNLLAFAQHVPVGDDGRVTIIDRNGAKKLETQLFDSLQGVAWRPDGKEVWFTAAPTGADRALYGVSLGGKQRLVLRVPGALVLQDISANGRVLMTSENARKHLYVVLPGETKERNLSWFDWSGLQALSEDGKVVLFAESGEATRASGVYGVYLRRVDDAEPVRLADGVWADLSPDGKWVVLGDSSEPPQFVLLPTGAGESRQITHDNLTHMFPQFTPDGQAIVFIGRAPGGQLRTYYQPLGGRDPIAITPEGIAGSGASHGGVITLSPDGAFVVAPDASADAYSIYPVHGGQPQRVKGVSTAEAVVGWSGDGKYLFTYRRGEVPARIYKVEIATGERQVFKQASPPDLAGVEDVTGMRITRDGRGYAYSYSTVLSDLYVVDGLR
jgi:Tol biopolymer transport system component